MLQKVRIWSN